MKILFLVTDAFGGRGGIAHYNRCLAEALAEMPDVTQITILPRVVVDPVGDLSDKIHFNDRAAGKKSQYIRALSQELGCDYDLLICGHINLLPLAAALAKLKKIPLVLQIHGIDVWTRPVGILQRACTKAVDAIWSVSSVTRDRMNQWARLPIERYNLIPNTIHLNHYGMAPRRQDMLERYGLAGKKVILTLARLDPRERYKGVDEILEVLSSLKRVEPDLCYLIAGTGEDQVRLQSKAVGLGVADSVIFAGFVPEAEKADLLRLADVFAMPGSGEGFGIVYLEALACGIPVVGSLLDGSRDALKNGILGELVDPNNRIDLQKSLLHTMNLPKLIPEELAEFAWPAFTQRVSHAVHAVIQSNLDV